MINDKEIMFGYLGEAYIKAVNEGLNRRINENKIVDYFIDKYRSSSLKQKKKRIVEDMRKMLMDFEKINKLIEEGVSENNVILAKDFLL